MLSGIEASGRSVPVSAIPVHTPTFAPGSESDSKPNFYLVFLDLEIALLGLVADSAIASPTHLTQLSVMP